MYWKKKVGRVARKIQMRDENCKILDSTMRENMSGSLIEELRIPFLTSQDR